MDIDDAIGGTPNCAVEFRIGEHRHMVFRLLGTPQLYFNAQLTAGFGIMFELLPTRIASQE